MKKPHLTLVLACTFVLFPFAANGEDLNCDSPVTTYEIRSCLSLQLEAVDGELNRVYKALRGDQDKEANDILRTAQRSWITYRDNECLRVADIVRGGTLAPVMNLSCIIDLTKRRTEELATNPLTGEVRY